MALEQKLSLKLSQKLVMTPSLQQAIKLLQMTRLELEGALTQELIENPVLEEREDTPEETEAAAAAETPTPPAPTHRAPPEAQSATRWTRSTSGRTPRLGQPSAPTPTRARGLRYRGPPHARARPHDLLWRLHRCLAGSARDLRALIGNLDPDGFLVASTDEIVHDRG
jgi:RNA polymerase sigma-54 factor